MLMQASFDELFLSSLAALEPFDTCDACSNVNSTGSIDDFLADYRHERSSIQSFLSNLEEPEAVNLQRSKFEDQKSAFPLDSALHSSKPTITTGAIWSFEAKQSTHAEVSCKQTEGANKHQKAPHRKILRSRTDSESQKERRRRKNCEYQRRFREKKMRLEMQRLYMAACSPCVHASSSRLT